MKESSQVDKIIACLDDWRGKKLAQIRKLIHKALTHGVEEVKWKKPSNSMLGIPVWSSDGIICTGETYKDKVKLTFAYGASLPDSTGLFNASLAGKMRRAIDLRETDEIDANAFQELVRDAANLNASKSAK